VVSNGSESQDSVDPMIGYLLDGRYELLQGIGSGGMSVVYKARLNNVGKMVAVKTLNIQVQAKDNVRERFHREIDLLLKLEHPHIVAVQDCLYGPNCQPYLVMDLLRGVTLEQELAKSGPMPSDRVRKIMIQVCAAVKYAHQHAVVHRDLKPGNIMLLENEVDFVKVLDFGLALIGENTRKITQSGEFWGSPPYASPEQVKGNDTDHRSDIYSLGCVMYELLCGKDPFFGAGLYELLSKHVNEQPAPLAVTNPQISVPAEMERIVFKCMEKRPQDRFQTVAELQAALENLNSGANATLVAADHNKGMNRLRSDQSFSSAAPPMEAKSYRTALVAGTVAVLLVLIVYGLSIMTGVSQPDVASNSRTTHPTIPAPSVVTDNNPASARAKAKSYDTKLSPSVNDSVMSRAKRTAARNVSRVRRIEPQGRSIPASRSRPAGIASGAKPASKPAGDRFAELRGKLSRDALSQ
jgi:serine/threonine protein kinase